MVSAAWLLVLPYGRWVLSSPRSVLSASLLVRASFCSPSASGYFQRRGSSVSVTVGWSILLLPFIANNPLPQYSIADRWDRLSLGSTPVDSTQQAMTDIEEPRQRHLFHWEISFRIFCSSGNQYFAARDRSPASSIPTNWHAASIGPVFHFL